MTAPRVPAKKAHATTVSTKLSPVIELFSQFISITIIVLEKQRTAAGNFHTSKSDKSGLVEHQEEMKKFISFLVILFSNAGWANLQTGPDKTVQNFVFFGRDRERITESSFLTTEKFVGAQLMYAWKELERGEDEYDFSEIQKDLDFLKSKGKKLFIQLQDTTFNPKLNAVPKYLTTEAKYHGGVIHQKNEHGKQEGWVLMRWDPAVADRLHKLLLALGKAFDGKIEGLTLQETAVGVYENAETAKSGFTYPKYRDAILENMKALKKAFSVSVKMQYVNFMPGEWLPDEDMGYMDSAYKLGKEIGVAIGVPDLLPKKKSQQNHSYKFMNAMGEEMILGVAVQDGNYSGTTNEIITPTEPWPNIVPELDTYARTFLKVNYIFWGAEEPYFSHDVVPYFK